MNAGRWALLAAGLLAACAEPAPPAPPGIDLPGRVIRVGVLNDESGPVASIGRPFAIGKRILAKQVNAGGSGLLPAGWTVQLVERDHGYDAQRAVQLYHEIRGQVLYLAHSFGTPNTLPLQPLLARDHLVAFPASLSSRMAEFQWTPPFGPSYRVEAMRAMDWVVDSAGRRVKQVRAGIVYQQDDYGRDSAAGWREAAALHGVALVAEQGYAPDQPGYTEAITSLQQAGATHVFLATVPSATGPLLSLAEQLEYRPAWIGNSPSWIDRFFDATVISPGVFAQYHCVNAFAVWGEDVPFMKSFLGAYRRYGSELIAPDANILLSYAQGLAGLHVARRMIESGELSRDGYLKALQRLEHYDLDGALPEPMDFSRLPYVGGTRTRVMKPDFARAGWKQVAPYARPLALGDTARH